MTGEFDAHGNIIKHPRKQRDKLMATSFEQEKKRLLNVPSELSDSVAFDFGFTGPKMLGIEPKVIDNNYNPNEAREKREDVDGVRQSEYLI